MERNGLGCVGMGWVSVLVARLLNWLVCTWLNRATFFMTTPRAPPPTDRSRNHQPLTFPWVHSAGSGDRRWRPMA